MRMVSISKATVVDALQKSAVTRTMLPSMWTLDTPGSWESLLERVFAFPFGMPLTLRCDGV